MVQFASYLRRVLCKTRLIFPRINGPIVYQYKGEKRISHNSSFICWFEEESRSLEKTHKRRLPMQQMMEQRIHSGKGMKICSG